MYFVLWFLYRIGVEVNCSSSRDALFSWRRCFVKQHMNRIMRAQGSWLTLLWTVPEQGRLRQGQGVSHPRSCLRVKEFSVAGNYFLVVEDSDYKFSV